MAQEEATVSTEEERVEVGDWGTLRVTRRCCGAGTCRNLAPELFVELGGAAEVVADGHESGAFTGLRRQPASVEDYRAARLAAAGCAFGAIRLSKPRRAIPREERGSPWKDFPRQLEPGVWLLGRPSARNYGAMAWFLERPEGGVLVDLPKPSKALFDWLDAHGGVAWIVLTHADHAQHHAEYAARFPAAKRVLGAADVNAFAHPYADATTEVEVKLPSDVGPVDLEGRPIPVPRLPEVEIALLPQPGHTPGGFCLLYKSRYLFTGDHLSWSGAVGHLVAHRLQCWEDWATLTGSIGTLERWARDGHLKFAWVLPGHGEWRQLTSTASPEATAGALARCLDWMREQPPGRVSLLRWVPFVIARTQPDSRFGRLVRAVLGEGGERLLLPAAVRRYLPDGRALRGPTG